MSNPFDFLISEAHVVAANSDGVPQQPALMDIGVRDGKIVALGDLAGHQAHRTMTAKGLTVLPGVIDSQVHFRDPGFPQKETFASGTRGAIMGGVTAVFDMPNTHPPTINAVDLADKKNRAEASAWCHMGFYMGASDLNYDRLDELEKLPGCIGIKVFYGSSTGNLLFNDTERLYALMTQTKKIISFHCEDETLLRERRLLLDKKLAENPSAGVHLHPDWRNEEVALRATQKVVSLAEKAGRQVHILHVTTKQEMQFLKEQKASANPVVSVECTPQHLTFFAPDCYDRLGTLAQMNPPIRTKDHQDGLWQGIADGTVDIIGSDHAPHTLQEKQKAYPNTPSGMTGVQTLLPLMLNHFSAGKLSLTRLVGLVSSNPARRFGLTNKGQIRIGGDADLTVVDLKKQRTIENNWIQSACGWTPFDGMKVQGWPVATLLNGEVVMRDDEVIGSPRGKVL